MVTNALCEYTKARFGSANIAHSLLHAQVCMKMKSHNALLPAMVSHRLVVFYRHAATASLLRLPPGRQMVTPWGNGTRDLRAALRAIASVGTTALKPCVTCEPIRPRSRPHRSPCVLADAYIGKAAGV